MRCRLLVLGESARFLSRLLVRPQPRATYHGGQDQKPGIDRFLAVAARFLNARRWSDVDRGTTKIVPSGPFQTRCFLFRART